MCPGLISPEHIAICEVIIIDEEITSECFVIDLFIRIVSLTCSGYLNGALR